MSTDVADEYRSLLVEIAGPRRMGENIKSVLADVSQRTGLGLRRVRGIWHGEVTDIRGREMTALLRAAREQRALEEAIHARSKLARRLAACEAALGLHAADDDRDVAFGEGGRLGGLDRALDDGA